MYQNTKKPVCAKCKGYGVIEVFNADVGFEVYEPCPACEGRNKPIDFVTAVKVLAGL